MHLLNLLTGLLTGIELKGKRRKKQGIDYNAEVAFEKKAPHGFHDVSKERETSKVLQVFTTSYFASSNSGYGIRAPFTCTFYIRTLEKIFDL